MKKKIKYYAVICPICGDKSVGNWKQQQLAMYWRHFYKQHINIPKPRIVSEMR